MLTGLVSATVFHPFTCVVMVSVLRGSPSSVALTHTASESTFSLEARNAFTSLISLPFIAFSLAVLRRMAPLVQVFFCTDMSEK